MHTKEQLLTKKILNWYDLNKRLLPWRKDVSFKKKQYYTLVSEFMLQQTQVVTVIPYFKRFIKFIPNLNSLAKVKNEKLETSIDISKMESGSYFLHLFDEQTKMIHQEQLLIK